MALDEQRQDAVDQGSDIDERASTFFNDAEKRLADAVTAHDGKISGLMTALDAQKAKAVEIVGIIAQTGMAGGFQKVANAERRSGFWWNVVAALSLVGLVVSAIFMFVTHGQSGTHWPDFASRAFTTLTFAALATFAAQRATNHRQFEQDSRRMELELASLGPFLNELSPEDKAAIYREVAERMFARPSHMTRSPKDEKAVMLPLEAALDIAKKALDAVKR